MSGVDGWCVVVCGCVGLGSLNVLGVPFQVFVNPET